MDVARVQDRIHWGLNRVAKVLGQTTDAYRPSGPSGPLERSNRYLRLQAAFSRPDGDFNQAVVYGSALWRGYFDAMYTRVGDYLVQGRDIWFIATQQSLLPVMCVKTNRVISITRPAAPTTGVPYGSASPDSVTNVISKWPANVQGVSSGEKSSARLPSDTTIPNWIALLPSIHGRIIQPSDVVTDEFEVLGVVIAAERSDLGWRLNVRQITT